MTIHIPFNDLKAELFKDFHFIDKPGERIIKGTLHPIVMDEIQEFLRVARLYKDHPLGFLRHHANIGNNTFQISVQTNILENSITLSYLTHLGERVFSALTNIRLDDLYRKISVFKHHNHFDGYDFWFNFATKGSVNPIHTHNGDISSVIYVQNTESEPTIFEDGFTYYGKPGEIILFNAKYPHRVDEKKTDSERITMSCNFAFNRNSNDE